VQLPQSKIKVNADHAGHSQPLVPSKVSTSSPTETSSHSLNNKSSIAPMLTETKDAMVAGHTGLCNTPKKYGSELESTYPYKAVDTKCTYNAADVKFTNTGGYLNVTKNNEVALATAVVAAPTSICIEADQPVFQLYTGGVITSQSCGTQLDHAVLVVGYDVSTKGQDYWIVKNSWGASWGLSGYVWVGKSNSTNTVGVCGIAMNPTNPQM